MPVDQGADAAGAWLMGEFQGAVDAPDCRDRWPADYVLRLTYRLEKQGLRIAALVRNPGPRPLPFGLGFHPYFHVPLVEGDSSDCLVQVAAEQCWELKENLPTGVRLPVSGARDLRVPRPLTNLQVDDVLTGLRGGASLSQPAAGVTLRVESTADFRELVAFTPPHRQAVCLEPYTCVTDAMNLQAQGVDAGLTVLPTGESWKGEVHLMVESGTGQIERNALAG
jgi:aldose 1-epimerase